MACLGKAVNYHLPAVAHFKLHRYASAGALGREGAGVRCVVPEVLEHSLTGWLLSCRGC